MSHLRYNEQHGIFGLQCVSMHVPPEVIDNLQHGIFGLQSMHVPPEFMDNLQHGIFGLQSMHVPPEVELETLYNNFTKMLQWLSIK